MVINRKAGQRHMREMGLAAIDPGPNLSKRALTHRVFPYLLRRLAITHPSLTPRHARSHLVRGRNVGRTSPGKQRWHQDMIWCQRYFIVGRWTPA